MNEYQFDAPKNRDDEPKLGVISDAMMNSLEQTKPWVGFLAIIGFISAGFMMILGLMIICGFKELHGCPGGLVIMGFFYFLMALLYYFPSIFLYNYSHSIGRFVNGGGTKDLERALLEQKSFWKFVGIYILVSLGLVFLMFLSVFLYSFMS